MLQKIQHESKKSRGFSSELGLLVFESDEWSAPHSCASCFFLHINVPNLVSNGLLTGKGGGFVFTPEKSFYHKKFKHLQIKCIFFLCEWQVHRWSDIRVFFQPYL